MHGGNYRQRSDSFYDAVLLICQYYPLKYNECKLVSNVSIKIALTDGDNLNHNLIYFTVRKRGTSHFQFVLGSHSF